MGFWDYYKGRKGLRDDHRVPFPQSLLRAREKNLLGADSRS